MPAYNSSGLWYTRTIDELQREAEGFDIDLANMVAKALGVKLEMQQVTGANRIPFLITNKVDIVISVMGLTPERAKQIMFTGARYDARTALRMGLVNDVYPAAELEQKVNELCEVIANNAPLSILSAKRVIDELVKDADKRDLALCGKVVADCFASQDYIEGRRAFMEKRFVGKIVLDLA